MTPSTDPGINKQVRLDHFSDEERKIIKRIGIEWYVTHSGGEIKLGSNSVYRYFLIKPTDNYHEMFNLEREIIVVFSPYENFEPRTLDAIEAASQNYTSLRLERICSVLISKDPNIETAIQEVLKNEKESQVIVPFTYQELLTINSDDYFIRNRLKKHFYSRDLFAFEGPLKSDLYFFGRSDLLHEIANRHKANENSALFGLRKTGKTSVIFGAQRALINMGANSAFIDCQNPSFHRRRWNKALYYIIQEIKKQNKLKIGTKTEENFTDEHASEIFETEILKIHSLLDKKNILLIFDEIENITFDISPSKHWSDGLDFIYFWQTLRSLYQKLPDVFSYLIVGTNSLCVETPTVHGKDNPIFNQVPFTYIEGFDVPQTREMIRKLGRLMGLKFDEIIYGKLTEDFGGHPFLIRHVCSAINKICPDNRPIIIDKALYQQGKKKFDEEYSNYIEMILTVLEQFYNDEYEMLKYLALGNIEVFSDFAKMSPYYTNHLLGYGIINSNNNNYTIRINSIQEYLVNKEKYKKINLTNKEKLAEISERRNILEQNLRDIIKKSLHVSYGKEKARLEILEIFGKPRKQKYFSATYDSLFDPNKTEIYLDDLRKIIIKHWDCFKNIFPDKNNCDLMLQTINKFRSDAHAKNIPDTDFEYSRATFTNFEKIISDFL